MFPFGPRKQIRSGNITGDYTTYDAGRFFVCVTGQTSAADIGKLWIDYDVELFVPQSSPNQVVSNGSNTAMYTLTADQTGISSGAYTTIAFDSTLFNNLSINNVAGVFTPPSGNYIIQLVVYTTGSSTTTQLGAHGDIYKNGVQDSVIIDAFIALSSSTSNRTFFVGYGYVSCNGTDTVELKVAPLISPGVASFLVETRLFWSLA
jgi:hypothetical protein